MRPLHFLHNQLVARLDTSDAIRAAFTDHPRHLYIPDLIWPSPDGLPLHRTTDPDRWAQHVYAFAPVTTQTNDGGSGPVNLPSSSSSHPQVMADMIAAAGVGSGSRVLEIGTGTGWNAAILDSLVGPTGTVTSVEIDPVIAAHAHQRLATTKVQVLASTDQAPDETVDAVISTCAVSRLPQSWIERVPVGSLIVTPWAPSSDRESSPVAALRKREEGSVEGPFVRDAVFMHDRTQRVPEEAFPGIGATPETTASFPATSDDLLHGGLLTRLMLMLPTVRIGVGARPFDGGIGTIVYLGAADSSWAYLWPDGSITASGTRDLPGELNRAYSNLVGAGPPPLENFVLQAQPESGLYRVQAPTLGAWEH